MAKGPGSEKSLQQKTAQIASKGTAREAYLKAISEDRRFSCFRHPGRRSPSLGRGHRSRRDALHPRAATDERHRNGAGAEQDLSGFDGAQHWTVGDRQSWQHQLYDSMGRNTGRSVTDSRGTTTFYDA